MTSSTDINNFSTSVVDGREWLRGCYGSIIIKIIQHTHTQNYNQHQSKLQYKCRSNNVGTNLDEGVVTLVLPTGELQYYYIAPQRRTKHSNI